MKIPAEGLRGAALREAQADLRARIDLLRAALQLRLGLEWVVIEALYADSVIVEHAGRWTRYPYTLGADNQVQIGDGVEVVKDFVPVSLREAAGVFVEAVGEPSAGRWLIRVIRAGVSGNGNVYPDAVLREAVPLFEGARVFVKSDAEHLKGAGKDVRNLIGGLAKPRFVEGVTPDSGEIQAELTLIQPEGAEAVKLREAHARGLAGLFGFSIDCTGAAKTELREGRRLRVATRISKVHSVDLIVEPGAGGELIRLVEAQSPDTLQEETDMALRQRMIEAIQAKRPGYTGENLSDEQLECDYREAVALPPAAADAAGAAALAQVRLVEARITARELIAAATLPQPAKDKLLVRFAEAKEPFTAEQVSAAISDERAYLAKFVESGKPVIPFDAAPRVEDRSQKIDEMLDAFFAGDKDVHSFKECYVEITGDTRVTGDLRNVDLARLRESLGERFTEALTSASWANVLGDSIARRMLADYASMTDLQSWRRIATVVPVNDFRTQERSRMGGYGNLPAVAQAGAYAALTSPSDEKATYAVTKRGGTETVTLEMVTNDDVGAIRRIPTELALAAANTLYEFVFDFIRTNPAVYDAVALFHASHGNLGTAALDATSFAAGRLAMAQQARAGSSKRLNIQPATVMVPFELQETAYNLFVRNQNLDKTFVQSINPEVIPVSYWTDANDWAMAADPRRCPTIEVGFLGGREDPELFVQDMPNVGSLFSNDQITYKIRHIYSGAVMDFRGLRKNVVV